MARPRKSDSERKTVDLRIPLTEAQKALVLQAAQAEGVDMATWARPLILRAAQEQLAVGHKDERS